MKRLSLLLRGPRIWLALTIFFGGAEAAKPAHSTPEPVTVRALKVGPVTVPKIFGLAAGEGEKRKLVEVPVPEQSAGVGIEIPFAPEMELFEGQVGSEAQRPKPFVKIPAKMPGQKFLLVFFSDDSGRLQHTFLDESVEAHPAGQVRVVNFSRSRAAFSVGGASLRVLPGNEATSAPVFGQSGRFLFRYHVERPPEPPYSSPVAPLRFKAADQRLLVILVDLPEEMSGEGEGAGNTVLAATAKRCQAVFVFDRIGARPDGSSGGGGRIPPHGPVAPSERGGLFFPQSSIIL